MNNYFYNNNILSNEEYGLLTSDDAKQITDQITQFIDNNVNEYFSKKSNKQK